MSEAKRQKLLVTLDDSAYAAVKAASAKDIRDALQRAREDLLRAQGQRVARIDSKVRYR